ncbi:hypothetical protein N9R79_09845 [Vibrio sp.]|nr:hypothetical protein [Vibrio sp.]
MANQLIKITIDDDLEPIPVDEQKWCLENPSPSLDTNRVLCTGEVIDPDTDAKWEGKTVVRGGITCDKCITIVKKFKAIKL